jgi:TPR repeat protein
MKYSFGTGVTKNDSEAVKWYRKAAEQDHVGAQYALGWAYYKGEGVPQDYGEAFNWYQKAAEQGDSGSQYRLGVMYEKGEGIAQDYVASYIWYHLASQTHGLEFARKHRNRVAEKMTSAQIAEAQRLAREWKPKKTN